MCDPIHVFSSYPSRLSIVCSGIVEILGMRLGEPQQMGYVGINTSGLKIGLLFTSF